MIQSALRGLLVVILVASSGCTLFGPGDSIDYSGEKEISDTGFRMEGQITNGVRGTPTEFDDVGVYLYSENRTLIRAVSAGTLVRKANVSVRTEEIPEYIVIHSPEFWDVRKISVVYYELVDEADGVYSPSTVSSKSELPAHP